MKNIPNAMKFSTQSNSSLLIINMVFEIADLGPKLKASDSKDLDSKLNASDVAIGNQNKSNMLIINILIVTDGLDPKFQN